VALRARVNGQEIDSIPVDDRGLAYGDGLFETIAVHREQPLLLEAHLNRLLTGCDVLQFSDPPSVEDLTGEIQALCADVTRGVIKLIVTRGDGLRGYDPDNASGVRTIVLLHPWPEFHASRQHGMRVGVCKLHLSSQPRLARIKHLNRLEHVLARAEWEVGWQEALLRDQHGHIVSGTQSNFFYMSGETLYTPPITDCGIAGVMRDTVVRCAREMGLVCEEKAITDAGLPGVQQAFMSNSLLGIGPVRELCGRAVKIGPMIRRLQTYISENELVVPD